MYILQTEYSDSQPTIKLSNITPPTKKLAVSRQRSDTFHRLSAKTPKNNKYFHQKETVKQPLNQTSGLPSPDCKTKHSFYELAWGIVSARRLRHNSVPASPHKRKGSKPESPISSPLVTISNYRNLLHVSHLNMGRQSNSNGVNENISNDVCESREDENLPASVENLVRRSAECFGRLILFLSSMIIYSLRCRPNYTLQI